jgi:predicted DsbA family dithiol-disulfide isomerase
MDAVRASARAPSDPAPRGEYLKRAWSQSVYPIARRMGVPIALSPVSPQPHTHLAFEGYQYAREHSKGNEYNHRVLEAFFVEGRDIGDIGVLTNLAGEVGLDEREFEEALRSRRYREAHRYALRHAYDEARVTGVPMLVIGERVLTGLQDQETLEAVIDMADRRAVCLVDDHRFGIELGQDVAARSRPAGRLIGRGFDDEGHVESLG